MDTPQSWENGIGHCFGGDQYRRTFKKARSGPDKTHCNVSVGRRRYRSTMSHIRAIYLSAKYLRNLPWALSITCRILYWGYAWPFQAKNSASHFAALKSGPLTHAEDFAYRQPYLNFDEFEATAFLFRDQLWPISSEAGCLAEMNLGWSFWGFWQYSPQIQGWSRQTGSESEEGPQSLPEQLPRGEREGGNPALRLISWSVLNIISWSTLKIISWSALKLISYSALKFISYSALKLISWSELKLISCSAPKLSSWSTFKLLSCCILVLKLYCSTLPFKASDCSERPQRRKMMIKRRDTGSLAWTCPWTFYMEGWTQRAK